MRRLRILQTAGCGLIAAVLFIAAPVQAQKSPDIANCTDKEGKLSAEVRIAACTSVIRSGKDIAWAFNNRGSDYRDKGEYDRAISDFSEAIRRNPTYTSAFYNRGIAYVDKKQFDRAVADYTKAISLAAPASVHTSEGTSLRGDQIRADYFAARGRAYQLKGDNARAVADLKESLRLNPDHKIAKDRLREVGGTP